MIETAESMEPSELHQRTQRLAGEAKVEMADITGGLAKAFFFGLLVTWICCYKGYTCGHGAEGVGRATTSAVVLSSVFILVGNYFLTSVLF